MGSENHAVGLYLALLHPLTNLLCLSKAFEHLIDLTVIKPIGFEIRQMVGLERQVIRAPIAEELQVFGMSVDEGMLLHGAHIVVFHEQLQEILLTACVALTFYHSLAQSVEALP